MKKTFYIILIVSLTISCKKDDTILEKNSKVKTKYIYANSSDKEPYSFTSYTYDDKWNLKKELISDYPSPIYASFTYEYSDDGYLISQKRWAKEGYNYPNQTESEFSLIWEKKYENIDNKKIEREYHDNVLTDSNIYIYYNDFLLEENHYDIKNSDDWSISYEYDSKNNLIKRTSIPDGTYTVYYYNDSKISKTLHYDNNDSLPVENIFIHTKSNNKDITEIHYNGPHGEYISDKITTENGNIVEYIKYHPTFQGAEWWCERYEYY